MEVKKISYTEQKKERALTLYDELGSIAKVIQKLDYASRQNMYTWIKNRNIAIKQKATVNYSGSPTHRRHRSLEVKLNILHRCFEVGEDIKSVSEDTGYSRATIYSWRRKYLSGGAGALMSKKKHLPRGELTVDIFPATDTDQEQLMAKEKELELENDILKETIKILKNKYSLSVLLEKMSISKSSYCY